MKQNGCIAALIARMIEEDAMSEDKKITKESVERKNNNDSKVNENFRKSYSAQGDDSITTSDILNQMGNQPLGTQLSTDTSSDSSSSTSTSADKQNTEND